MLNFVGKLALRYQRKRRGFVSIVSLFSVIGITLGVAALIIVMSVMTGFRQELLNTVLGITGHAVIQQPDFNFNQAQQATKKLLKNKEIKSAYSFISGQAMITANGMSSGVLIKGVDPQKQSEIFKKLLIGNSKSLNDNEILLGNELAKKIGVKIGQKVNLISPNGTHTIAGFIPRIKTLRVAGIFKFGMYQYDSSFIYTNIKTAQQFFKLQNNITGIEIKVNDPMQIKQIRPEISMIFNDLDPRSLPPFINTWQQNNLEFFKALEIEKRTMFIILMLIIVVAAFNIITGQMMLVNDKTKDIAILRSMGASSGQIQKVFFYSGMLLGIGGTLAGSLLGSIIVLNLTKIVIFIENLFNTTLFSGQVYFLDKLPAILNIHDVALVTANALLLSIIGSWFPSRKASKLDPVEILRND